MELSESLWDVPSVNRLDYTDSLENAVKTVLYAFNGGT